MLKGFNKKIKYQLKSQGFDHIADLSNQGSQPYFMQDTIHLGWNGWYAFDKKVKAFVDGEQEIPSYKMNNQFYAKSWQNLAPDDLNSYIKNNG